MGRRPNSTPEEIDRFFELRDVQGLKWREIADRIGGTEAGLCARYLYYKQKRRLEVMREGRPIPAKPRKVCGGRAAPAELPTPTVLAPPIAPQPVEPVVVKRPRYFHDADADIAARIRRQGITAGVLGDPPPGRSALDQKRAGA